MVLRIACTAGFVLGLAIAFSASDPAPAGAEASRKRSEMPRVHRFGGGRKTFLGREKQPRVKPRLRRFGDRPKKDRNAPRVLRFGTRAKTDAPSPVRPPSVARVRFGGLVGPLGRQNGFSQFDTLPRGVMGFTLPEQTRFPRYYRYNRRWATGATCPPVIRGIRYGFEPPYGRYGSRRGSLLCGQFEGGRTVLQGSPWRSRIRPGLTVEQGSPWRGQMRPGLTVRQGSPWRGRVPGGLTVDQGSPWGSSFKNWRFSAYDPARFPEQSAAYARPRLRYGPAFARGAFPVQRASRFRSRIRAGRLTSTKKSPWRRRARY